MSTQWSPVRAPTAIALCALLASSAVACGSSESGDLGQRRTTGPTSSSDASEMETAEENTDSPADLDANPDVEAMPSRTGSGTPEPAPSNEGSPGVPNADAPGVMPVDAEPTDPTPNSSSPGAEEPVDEPSTAPAQSSADSGCSPPCDTAAADAGGSMGESCDESLDAFAEAAAEAALHSEYYDCQSHDDCANIHPCDRSDNCGFREILNSEARAAFEERMTDELCNCFEERYPVCPEPEPLVPGCSAGVCAPVIQREPIVVPETCEERAASLEGIVSGFSSYSGGLGCDVIAVGNGCTNGCLFRPVAASSAGRYRAMLEAHLRFNECSGCGVPLDCMDVPEVVDDGSWCTLVE